MELKGVILIEPKHHANVGGIARSMMAFGFDNLIIVNPPKHLNLTKAGHVSEQGKYIIEKAVIVKSLKDIEGAKIATISRQDNKKLNLPLEDVRKMTFPEEFYLVMGRESTGFNKEEAELCTKAVTIETNGKYGVLNLCQATTIILHELYSRKI